MVRPPVSARTKSQYGPTRGYAPRQVWQRAASAVQDSPQRQVGQASRAATAGAVGHIRLEVGRRADDIGRVASRN
ncbi:MAG: hypothetical protein QOE03_2375, partial [Micromonosporaceae bacterium]|nr:hypothetical protein [Micromonosporaceae bacterium]